MISKLGLALSFSVIFSLPSVVYGQNTAVDTEDQEIKRAFVVQGQDDLHGGAKTYYLIDSTPIRGIQQLKETVDGYPVKPSLKPPMKEHRSTEGTKVKASQPVPLPYIGVGSEKTKDVLLYPVKHPIGFCDKLTFPFRHPCIATKRFGEEMEPYQNAMNAGAAIGGMTTPFAVSFFNKASTKTIVQPAMVH